MYISARQIERDIRIYKHDDIENAIKQTSKTILDQLKDYLRLIQLHTSHVTIENIFESKDEGDIENAEKLQYLIDNIHEIIEKLKLNISNNSNINLKKNSIKIELDSNRQNNSTLKLNINHDVLTKDELVNDETLLTIEYEESYAD